MPIDEGTPAVFPTGSGSCVGILISSTNELALSENGSETKFCKISTSLLGSKKSVPRYWVQTEKMKLLLIGKSHPKKE